jgi:hypothetical protein
VRVLVLLVLLAGVANADPYDYVGGGVAIGLGAPASMSGDLGSRYGSPSCDGNSCLLVSRMVFGGSVRRWSVELMMGGIPLDDATAFPENLVFVYGPVVRYSVFRRWGFDASVRVGVEHGSVDGQTTTMDGGSACDHCTVDSTPSYGFWGASAGVTVMARAHVDNGYFGVFVDVDRTLAHLDGPDGGASGVIGSTTFGITFGSMMPLH